MSGVPQYGLGDWRGEGMLSLSMRGGGKGGIAGACRTSTGLRQEEIIY
jgi:hypothetical protein